MTGEDRFKQLVIDAIVGVGFPSVVLAQECERVGLAHYGEEYDQYFGWDRKALWAVSVDKLQELYDGLCEQREQNAQPTEPLDKPLIVLQ